ncbi:VOC family protein [Kitasatospora sp. NPDC006697]|uniref:VOC family protein n=1 Tax=Kitasatospora sp. NPDC006697 TaxID=3364020 RepID=UPI003697EDB8
MALIDSITLEVADLSAAARFYSAAFGLDCDSPSAPLHLRAAAEPTAGFRGYTLSLTVAQPADANAYLNGAIEAGATVLKPASKSLWGYGGTVQAPDGAIWKVATSNKKDTAPAARRFDAMVLLLGVEDVTATKTFYLDHGLTVAKSFGRKYVEFEAGDGPVKLGLYQRRALAKDAGVAPEGSGSHRLAITGTTGAFTDPDGFAWLAAAPALAHPAQ